MASDVTGEEFNVGSGTEASAKEIAERLIAIIGADVEVQLQPDVRVLMRRRVGSSEKAKRLLGWSAARDLDSGLRDVVDWIRRSVRVLVTGATGFVASHLIPALADAGHEVVALGHDPSRIPAGDAIEPLVVDLAAPDWPALPTVDAIVHLAQANVPFPGRRGRSVRRQHRRDRAAARPCVAEPRRPRLRLRLVGARSTGSATAPLAEKTTPLAATDFYAATKIAAERFVGAYARTSARRSCASSPRTAPGRRNRLIPRLIAQRPRGEADHAQRGRPAAHEPDLRRRRRDGHRPLRSLPRATSSSTSRATRPRRSASSRERDRPLVGVEPVFEEGSAPRRRRHRLLTTAACTSCSGSATLVALDDGSATRARRPRD